MTNLLRIGNINVITIIERTIASITIIAVITFAIFNVEPLLQMDWGKSETFYEFLYRILLVVIGIEFVRMLLTHSIEAVLELLAFVVARKMLKPDLATIDVLMGIVGFVLLTGARRYFLTSDDSMVHKRTLQS